jgi:hypothetical protein
MDNFNTHKMMPIPAKVMAITDFFQEFLINVIQENSNIPNFEYEVI